MTFQQAGHEGIYSVGVGTFTSGDRLDVPGRGGCVPQPELTGASHVRRPTGLVFRQEGALCYSDTILSQVRCVNVGLPALAPGATTVRVPSPDASEIYEFDGSGRHLRTMDGLTGVTTLTFQYDSKGRLANITDLDGNITTYERDSGGKPSGIVGPYGQRTVLTVDAQERLHTVTNPAGETTTYFHRADGLMTKQTDPEGHSFVYSYDGQGQ